VSRDNIPAIVLNQWETTADYLDDDLLDGVMPVLFADDVRAAEAAILEAPLTAKRDLERLAKIYFVPETLDLNQAEAIVRKPRLREVISGSRTSTWKGSLRRTDWRLPTTPATGQHFRKPRPPPLEGLRAALQESAEVIKSCKKKKKNQLIQN
jgi:hypothetical protein